MKKKGHLPQSYPEITPRPDRWGLHGLTCTTYYIITLCVCVCVFRCGLGAESIHKSTDHSTRSLVAKKLHKSLKSEKRYCSLSSTHDEDKQEEEEGGKVAVLSKAVIHKHARATLADLRKKKRKRKRTFCINGLDRSNVKNVAVTDELSTSVSSSQSLVETAGHSSDDVDTQPHTTVCLSHYAQRAILPILLPILYRLRQYQNML